MKRVAAVVIVFTLLVGGACAKESFTAFGSTVLYDRPDPEAWKLVKDGKQARGRAYLLMFEHTPIKDDKGRLIRPVIAIVAEEVPKELDVIKYSIWKRAHTPFKVNKLVTFQDGDFSYRNSVGFEGEYDRKVLHRVFVAHLRHGTVGLQIICDSTNGVYDKVEKDMRAFLHSVAFQE